MSVATCHTEGCGNAGVPIDVGELTWTDPETGEVITSSVACGVCGQPITDVTDDAPPPDPPVVDNTLPNPTERNAP